MKFTLATIVLLAGFAVALPQNAKQDAAAAKVAANAKADDTGNAAANDGSGGIAAADKAEAAILLSDNGDAGAVQEGADFEKAVQAISDSGNQDELDVLEGAGINVDDVLGGGNGQANAAAAKAGGNNANAQQGQKAQAQAKGQAQQQAKGQ